MNDGMSRLNTLFREYSTSSPKAGKENVEDIMMTLLYLYVELQKVSEAELIFTQSVLKPFCDKILAKKGNISSLLDSLETFLLNCPTINVSKRLGKHSWLSNYSFLSKCVFPHVVGILTKHFPHIWSPSNPDTFHSNWIRCDKFITFLEEQMPSLDHLESFRESETFKSFISKWQFPVYFQLRFHSLAVELESSLDDVNAPCATSDFKLDSTRVLIKVLKQCWDTEKVYIHHISGRFLRASALLVARYIKAIEMEVTPKEKDDNIVVPITTLLNIYCDLKIAELIVQQLLSEKLATQLCSDQDSEGSSLVIKLPPALSNFFQDFRWQQSREMVETRLIQITISQSSSSISQVSEVPRLYRRTNRELPSKHGDYVETILEPVNSLKSVIESSHQGELWENIGFQIANQISQR